MRVWDAWNCDICSYNFHAMKNVFHTNLTQVFIPRNMFFMQCPRRFSCHETFVHTMPAQVFMPRNIFFTPCSRKFSCMCAQTSHATNTFVELGSCARPGPGPSPGRSPAQAWAWARLGPLPDSGPEAESQGLDATEGKIKGSACQILGSGGQILRACNQIR